MHSEQKEGLLLSGIQKRLDVLISLTLRREMQANKAITTREMITLLSSLGLKYGEIASIFGKSPTYIASELTLIKKRGEKNGRKQ